MRNSFSFGAPGTRYVPLNEQKPQQQSQQGGLPPLGLINQFSGGNSFFGGLGGQAGGGSAAGGGTSSALASAGPWAALAAAIALNENYQGNIGNRDDESFTGETALTGRALYKDAPGWGEKADDILPGLGSGIRSAGALSSPYDLVAGDGLSDFWDEAKRGGTIGSIFRELF